MLYCQNETNERVLPEEVAGPLRGVLFDEEVEWALPSSRETLDENEKRTQRCKKGAARIKASPEASICVTVDS